jgi:hypothetical protein
VSGTGTELRDLLEAAVGEPPRHVDLAAVRHRVRRRRWTESGAVAMAIGLVGALGVIVFTHAPGTGSAGPTVLNPAHVHAGEPAHYVQQVSSMRGPMVMRVRATVSGKVTATVHCPWQGAAIAPGAIAPAGLGVFFVACERSNSVKGSQNPQVTQARLYRFRVTAAGRVTGFSLVKGGTLGQFSVGDVAVTPGGSEAAVALGPAQSDVGSTYGVVVINTKTGARAVWGADKSRPEMVLSDVGDLSLTSNGRELAFQADTKCEAGEPAGCPRTREVRAVSPASAGGELINSRLLFRSSDLHGQSTGYVNDAVLSPDGSTLNVAVVGSGRSGSLVSVLRVSATTGKQLRVLYRVDTGNGMSYQYFSQDPTGRYMMLDAGPSSQTHNGWIYHHRLVRMTPYKSDNVRLQAW